MTASLSKGETSTPSPSKSSSGAVSTASTVAEIRDALAQLSTQDAAVTSRLDKLASSQKLFSHELGRLDILRAQLGSQVVHVRAISNGMLSDAASTAERISGAVRRLDQEQANVKATLEVVEQVAELKACVLGVHGSMGAPQDWETAAGYLSRASMIPNEVIDGGFAEQVVPTAEVPDPPRITLNNAAESLCGLFLREFEKAAKEGDGTRVTRFFKLFPLIGRSDTGLDAYGRYVCQGVASRARANLNAGAGAAQRKESFFHANALTKLFEHIAQIVDGHEPLVERHYGPGMMTKVIERLQMEADSQGGIIIDTWSDERSIDRKLTDVRSYAFSFLVQSFLPPQRSNTGTPRSDSPATRDRSAAGRVSEDEGVDMKEVDGLVGEMALMLSRWSLYSRFIATKTGNSSTEKDDAPRPANLAMPPILENSNLAKKVSTSLIEPFNVMTTFFFRRSVEKAFQLDEAPPELSLNMSKQLDSNPPFITSAVDDVMYILNQVLQRSLSTSQRAVMAVVVSGVARVLSSDFVGMIQRKMRDESYPKAAIQGALPPEDKIIAFLVLLNNLDVATEYIKRIVSTNLGEERASSSDDTENSSTAAKSSTPTLSDLFPFESDAAFVAVRLRSLETSFEAKISELLSDGINVTFHQVIAPRLRPILADAFRDIEYQLGSSSDDNTTNINNTQASSTSSNLPAHPNTDTTDDPALVPTRFSRSWAALTRPLARILTPRNADRLLAAALPPLARALEKRLWALQGRVSELGAARLERDVAGIVSAAVAGGKYSLRDAFARCVQICLVLNLEEDEWVEVMEGLERRKERRSSRADEKKDEDGEGVAWVLSKEEMIRARAIVTTRS